MKIDINNLPSGDAVEEEKHGAEATTFLQRLDDAPGAASSARFR